MTSLPPIDAVAHLRAYAGRSFSGDANLLPDMFAAFRADGRPIGAGPIDRIGELDIPDDAEIALFPATLRQVRAALHGRVE